MKLEHSRAIRLAAQAADEPESALEARLNASRVVVSCDPYVSGALAAAEIALSTLRRGPGQMLVDPRPLGHHVAAAMARRASRVAPEARIAVEAPPPDAVQVHFGLKAPPEGVAVVPDRYGARLSRGPKLRQTGTASRLGVVLAASWAVGEAFKLSARVREDRMELHRELSFCPVTLSDDLALAPELPPGWRPHLGLIGNGAVGTAHAVILDGGFEPSSALAVDNQSFAIENLATYSLGTVADALEKVHKTRLVEACLGGWDVDRFEGPVEAVIAAIDAGEVRWPEICLVGLDSVPARHDAQRFWSDHVIDASTGDTAVGLRHARHDGPCLFCFLEEPRSSRSATDDLIDLGLPPEVAVAGDELLRQDTVDAIPDANKRVRLQAFVGKPVCGLARALALTEDDAGRYMPAVSFVSQQAACLGVGRLVAIATGIAETLPNYVQYDALLGPGSATKQIRPPEVSCRCQIYRQIIETVRAERQVRR